ncbi:MAG TPA: ABC transporter permease [Chryseosolibacter sp.]|nr:ABC transporter permease [Chryseosolibacter sp.]
MIKNYLKIAFRSLWRSKGHSFINVFGLSLGIGCCILIILFVKDEWTFDRFHSKADRIFRAYAIEDYGENQLFFDTSTPFPMGPALKDNFQEVEEMVRINPVGAQVRIQEALFSEQVMIAGQRFLEVFDFEVIAGDKNSALNDQVNVVLSESTAKKYFGDQDPINQVIAIQLGERFEDFTVKAVLQDPPTNSSISYTLLISDLNYPKLYSERLLTSAWFNITPETYVLLREGVDAKELEKKFPPVFKSLLGDDFEKSKYFVGLQPLVDIHLDTSFPPAIAPVSDPKYSYILAAIAVLILSVACINFVTLSVGRSLKRTKEVGIRKVVGAQRRQLILQFIGEAVIITIFSLLIGIVLAIITLPMFNEFAGKQLAMRPDGFMGLVVLALVIVIGLMAGSYPAFVLSGFRPIAILKGNVKSGDNKQTIRKVLVGIQLVLSIFLIASTLLMHRQLNYLQSKNLGFSRDQLAVVQLNVTRSGRMRERIVAGFEKAEQFKDELSKSRGIVEVCASSHDFGNGDWTNVGYTDDKGVYRTFFVNTIDDDYIPAMKIELAAGRNFSDANPADRTRSIIVNEAFVREYGWKEPLGQRIPGKNFVEHEVVGVVKDFNYASLYTKVQPLVMALNPSVPFSGIENINFNNSPMPKLLIRMRAGQIVPTLEEVKTVWDKLTGGEEFAFSFVDEALARQYRNDQNLGRIVRAASLLAIIIGSLGLYGLASLALQNRTKEISIRKVFGASQQSLLFLLSKEYLVLILVSVILSVPATVFLMSKWLTTFEYRVRIGADIFLMAGAISLLIAFVTISYQILKTAWTQPAETLKYE